MFTSDINNKNKAFKTAFVYLLISLFCAFFGAVYEIFSHGVYSYFMIYAFGFTLAGGTLPFSILALSKTKWYPNKLTYSFYHYGIATLTVGSIVRGVLDIYGTSNDLSNIYWWVGFAFILVSFCAAAADTIKRRKTTKSQ